MIATLLPSFDLLGARTPLQVVSAKAKDFGLGRDVAATGRQGALAFVWSRPGLRGEDRGAWSFLPFDAVGAGSIDLSRTYATTWIALRVKGDPGRLAVSFWDAHGQNGKPVVVADKGRYVSKEEIWYVPMASCIGERLDLVRGLAIGQAGNPAPATSEVELPIRLIGTGRKDDRPLTFTRTPSAATVTVRVGEAVKNLDDYGFGCHWDFSEGMEDADAMKAPIAFYRDMGFNMVRTSAPRVSAENRNAQIAEIPRREWPKMQPLPLTDLFGLYHKAGFTKIATILPFNAYFKEPRQGRPSLNEWSRELPSTARVLRAERTFDTRYYELGNEIWAKDNRMGGAASGDKGGYIGSEIPGAIDLYATRIKAADPGARFMASYSGFDSSWPFLMKALPNLDAINFSLYGWEESYEKFRGSTTLPIAEAERRLRAVDLTAADRIRFGATEFAPHDWAPGFEGKGWTNANDLGHALWGFAQAAESLVAPKMAFACQWTVRWFWEKEDRRSGKTVWRPDDVYPAADWDLLTGEGKPTALSTALRLLGRNRLDEVVGCSASGQPQVMAFAVRSHDRRTVNVFILNKDYEGKKLTLELPGVHPKTVVAQVFTGNGLNDPEPTVRRIAGRPKLVMGKATFAVPELSVTLLTFRL